LSLAINIHVTTQEKWTHDPFGAEKDANGNIYARGSQDMKCVSIQHIEAVATLKKHHLQPLRTIHLSLVPDEEIGGVDGVAKWVESEHFKSLNIGFALDEGLANPSDTCLVFYGERVPWCTLCPSPR
jgi:aminoacylase